MLFIEKNKTYDVNSSNIFNTSVSICGLNIIRVLYSNVDKYRFSFGNKFGIS